MREIGAGVNISRNLLIASVRERKSIMIKNVCKQQQEARMLFMLLLCDQGKLKIQDLIDFHSSYRTTVRTNNFETTVL